MDRDAICSLTSKAGTEAFRHTTSKSSELIHRRTSLRRRGAETVQSYISRMAWAMTARHRAASSGSSSVGWIVTRLDLNFGAGVLGIEAPSNVFASDLPVVFVDLALEGVEDDRFIKVWPS